MPRARAGFPKRGQDREKDGSDEEEGGRRWGLSRAEKSACQWRDSSGELPISEALQKN